MFASRWCRRRWRQRARRTAASAAVTSDRPCHSSTIRELPAAPRRTCAIIRQVAATRRRAPTAAEDRAARKAETRRRNVASRGCSPPPRRRLGRLRRRPPSHSIFVQTVRLSLRLPDRSLPMPRQVVHTQVPPLTRQYKLVLAKGGDWLKLRVGIHYPWSRTVFVDHAFDGREHGPWTRQCVSFLKRGLAENNDSRSAVFMSNVRCGLSTYKPCPTKCYFS